MRCLWIMFATAVCFLFLLNCMMLQWAPHMLKKLGINKLRKRSKLPGIHRPNRPCLCWKAGCCKATWRNWQERKPACTHCGQLTEYPTVLTPSLPTPLTPKISFYILNWYQFIFAYIIFQDLILHIPFWSIITYYVAGFLIMLITSVIQCKP